MALKRRNSGEAVDNYRLKALLIGKPGEGKTTCAATISAQCPQEFPPKEVKKGSRIALDDTIWILIDGGGEHGGLDTLYDYGLDVDYYDLTSDVGKVFEDNLLEAIAESNSLVRAGKKSSVVLDSGSAAAKIILARYRDMLAGATNPWSVHDAILSSNLKIFMKLREIPGNVITIFHDKFVHPADTRTPAGQQQKKAREAVGIQEGAADLDITGQIRNMYVQNSSYILPVRKLAMPGGRERYVITPYSTDIISKRRTTRLLKEEPADLRVILRRIKGEI